MNKQELLDIYSDYLLSAFGQTTATGLSSVLNGSVSHDRITRFLGSELLTSTDLWRLAKKYVRQIEGADGVLILDDSIAEKPYTDENDIICRHHTRWLQTQALFLYAYYQSELLPVCVR